MGTTKTQSACASTQYDQHHVICSIDSTSASFWSWAGRFESCLVANLQRQVFSWHGLFSLINAMPQYRHSVYACRLMSGFYLIWKRTAPCHVLLNFIDFLLFFLLLYMTDMPHPRSHLISYSVISKWITVKPILVHKHKVSWVGRGKF